MGLSTTAGPCAIALPGFPLFIPAVASFPEHLLQAGVGSVIAATSTDQQNDEISLKLPKLCETCEFCRACSDSGCCVQVVPRCPRCPPEEPLAIMKPDIVFFGENLPEQFHRAMKYDKNEVDLLIVIGSSLKVRPVALIPSK